jgi:hypothetical protein
MIARVHAGCGYIRIQSQILRIVETIRYAIGGRGEPVEEAVVSQIAIERVEDEVELPSDVVEAQLVSVAAVFDLLPPGLHGSDNPRVIVSPDEDPAGD